MQTYVCFDIDGKRYAVYISKVKVEVETDGASICAEDAELMINGRYYDAVRTEQWHGREHHFVTNFGSAKAFYSENQMAIEFYDRAGNRFWGTHVQLPVNIQGLTTINISGTVKPLSGGEETC